MKEAKTTQKYKRKTKVNNPGSVSLLSGLTEP